MSPAIPRPLEEIASFLRNSAALGREIVSGGDARAAAASSEPRVISLLQNERRWGITNPNIGRGHNRAEYDFKVNWEGEDIFVDIKVSKLRGADNANCKAGIYHALTGEPPENAPVPYEHYFRKLRDNCNPTSADFYFLVVGKNEPVGSPARAFVCALRTLAQVTPNGNNLPFQCRWIDCMRPKPRTYEEARRFLLANYRASLKKRAEAFIAFEECFPDIRPS